MLFDALDFVHSAFALSPIGYVWTRRGAGAHRPRFAHLDSPKGGEVNVATEFPSFRELLAIKTTLFRSTVLGTLLGIVPGAGATITSCAFSFC